MVRLSRTLMASVLGAMLSTTAFAQTMTDVGTPRSETLIVQTFDGRAANASAQNPMNSYAIWRGFRELGWSWLWEMDTATGQSYPELAAGPVEVLNDEHTQFRVKLREGVYWSDGVEFTADDVIYSLDTYTKYRSQLVGNSSGAPLDQALRLLPGNNLSNAPELVATGSVTWTPDIGSSGLTGLIYIDGRMTSDYNTGSDLLPQKEQDGYALFNARIGVRGPDEKWGIELWAQNLFNKQYAQVAFNSPFQEGGTSTGTAFADPQYPGGRQLFSQFLAEPRTYGVTLRGKF